jgi:hypothetical protein
MNWNEQQGCLIEHVSDILGQCVKKLPNVNNVNDLSRACQQDWNQITIHKLQKLIRNMAVVAAQWRPNKYWIAYEFSHIFCDIFSYEKLT